MNITVTRDHHSPLCFYSTFLIDVFTYLELTFPYFLLITFFITFTRCMDCLLIASSYLHSLSIQWLSSSHRHLSGHTHFCFKFRTLSHYAHQSALFSCIYVLLVVEKGNSLRGAESHHSHCTLANKLPQSVLEVKVRQRQQKWNSKLSNLDAFLGCPPEILSMKYTNRCGDKGQHW